MNYSPGSSSESEEVGLFSYTKSREPTNLTAVTPIINRINSLMMSRANVTMKGEGVTIELSRGTQIQDRPSTISTKNNMTNTFAFDSLHCLSTLKLSKNLQSKTIISAGINNINLINTNFNPTEHNV
jgi:hypothetical protein